MKDKQNKEIDLHNLKHLSDKDLLFLIENYVTRRQDHEHIAELIKGDEDIISRMIDSDQVFEKVMHKQDKILQASPYFLFTLLMRRIFKIKKDDIDFIDDVVEELNKTGYSYPWNRSKVINLLNNTDVSNYVANMLAKFIQTSQIYKIGKDEEKQYRYIIDMVEEIQYSDDARRFYIYCHIGNYTLFFTGWFPEYIEHRFKYKKVLVDSRYYVDFGKMYFGLASEHNIARQQEIDDILYSLSEGFEIITKLLHHMRNEYLGLYI